MLKCVLLLGGPNKGTRFRPLSLDMPKPLFPVAGYPMIQHHIEAAIQVPGMKEILLIGTYQQNEALNRFVSAMQQEHKITIRYLQEYTALGTGGGIHHFRDQILTGNPDLFFVINCDVCGDFPLTEMAEFQRRLGSGARFVVLGTEATRQQSLNYGCLVEDENTHEVRHYVEKPETFVSTTINCGVYLLTPDIFPHMKQAFVKSQQDLRADDSALVRQTSHSVENCPSAKEMIRLEQDVLAPLAGTGQLYVLHTDRFWSQVKSAGAAIYANRHFLNLYRCKKPEVLAKNADGLPTVKGDVFIHTTASVHPSATLGPNVTIGKNVTVGPGVRIRESILLEGAVIQDHSCILHSVIGWNSSVGAWSRVEGTPNDPNPNKPFAKLDIPDTFNNDGRLNPSITVIGSYVQVPAEVMILNSIVLPHKEIQRSFKNQIIL